MNDHERSVPALRVKQKQRPAKKTDQEIRASRI
jgi:hypothetical protein